jgi:predicted N-acetyltransferase YhbS
MIAIREELPNDIAAREELLDAVFGEARFAKASERLREDRLPVAGLSFVACEGTRVVGTNRLWDVMAGPNRPALLLGPLAVASERRNGGIGTRLMRHALHEARRLGHRAILLVGDAPFYGRFGFTTEKTSGLWLPGPFERHRLLGRELVPGALHGARGLISATGRPRPRPDLADLVAAVTNNVSALTLRVA